MRISDWSSDVCSSDLPKSVIDLIWPSTLSPFLWMAAKVSHGLDVTCLMPSEMRRRSSSTSSTMTSSSSPTWTTLDGLTFLLVQSISDTCTRPSTPGSIRSEEHTSELQSLMRISYAVFCLNKKNTIKHK